MNKDHTYAAHAFIDWDDTLRLNQVLYQQVRQENASILTGIFAAFGETAETVKALVHKLDLAMTTRYGLAAHRYPSAWIRAYEYLCRKYQIPIRQCTVESLWKTAYSVYTRPQPPAPGAENLISWLHQVDCEVSIWTAGDTHIQLGKIRRSGWGHFLDDICVVPEKTPQALAHHIGNRPKDRCFVIGNSAASDVKPALELGIMAVHIPRETWEYDEAELDSNNGCYLRLPNLWHVPAVLIKRLGLSSGYAWR